MENVVQEFLSLPHLVSFVSNIIHYCDTLVTIHEPVLIYYYSLKSIFHSYFFVFYLTPLFQDPIQDSKVYLVIMCP